MGFLLAVYGTLKKGYANHDRYLKDAKFIGRGLTLNKYILVIAGVPFCIPIDVYGCCEELAGKLGVEVYEVGEEMLKKIDLLEGHPNWYKRILVDVELEDGEIVKAWLYIYPKKIEGDIIEPKDGVVEF